MLEIGSNINEVRVDGSLKALQRDLLAFQEFGLTAAEISIHGVDAVRNGRLDHRRTSEIQKILADFPFAYSTHAPNPLNLMNAAHPDMHRDVLQASLEFTAAIGARCMVYHPGRFLPEEQFASKGPLPLTPLQQEPLLRHEAELLGEAADGFPGTIIAMENARPYLHHSPYCYAEIPHMLAFQVKQINRSNVRITLDFGHLHLSTKFYNLDMISEVRSIAPHIAHCHVHDNFGHSVYATEKIQTHQLPFGKGDSHMPVGWGNIPFSPLFREFIRNYNGLLICELRSRYFEQTGVAARNLLSIIESLEDHSQLRSGKGSI
ncbi:MAG: sugar phosphate isomerase/epimerase [Desulforhopalus sp.]|nr:sugar phosphate isomerase/epimerase [Desulforhopalus sp.]